MPSFGAALGQAVAASTAAGAGGGSYTTSDITPLAWPGANLTGSGCNSSGGSCPGGFIKVSASVSNGCPRDCGNKACLWNSGSCCFDGNQQNQTECGVDPGAAGAPAKMCPTVPGLTPTSYIYSQGMSCPYGSASTALKTKCTYSGVPTDPFGQGTVQTFTGSTDLARIQQGWCNATNRQATELDANRTNCINAYGGDVQGVATYDGTLLAVCGAMSDWTTVGACMNVVSTCIRSGSDGANQTNFATAQRMALDYCAQGEPGTMPGPNRTKELCGCINAEVFGFYTKSGQTANCYNTGFMNLPGCAEVVTATQGIVALGNDTLRTQFQDIATDSGKFTQYCQRAEMTASSDILPFESDSGFGSSSVITNICDMTAVQGLAQNSPIKQQCNITTTLGGSPGGGAPPPGSPGAPPGSPASSSLPIPALSNIGLDTPAKQYGGIVGCILFICACLIVILLLASG